MDIIILTKPVNLLFCFILWVLRMLTKMRFALDTQVIRGVPMRFIETHGIFNWLL